LVEKLRETGALSISLVAEVDGKVVGHIAFSPVSIQGEQSNWYGLAPVSVLPAYQRQGIGGMLIQAGLAELHKMGAAGCVLLGEPAYYGRLGFAPVEGLTLAGVPPEYFLTLPFSEEKIQGEVAYHKAFEICG
jgi:putative acetyltransferase